MPENDSLEITDLNQRRILTGATAINGAANDILPGLAANIAKGRSLIHNVHYIDRGYGNLMEKLTKIGLKIRRIRNDQTSL